MFKLCTKLHLLAFVMSVASASLHSTFRHYEEISTNHIKVRSKREANSGKLQSKRISFNAFQKAFHLNLFPDVSILSPDFAAHTIDPSGSANEIHILKDGIFSGYLEGNIYAAVDAVSFDNQWYIRIWTPEDTYNVEPLQHFDPLRPRHYLLIYRGRDILTNITKSKSNKNSFCKTVNLRGVENKPGWNKFTNDNLILQPNIHPQLQTKAAEKIDFPLKGASKTDDRNMNSPFPFKYMAYNKINEDSNRDVDTEREGKSPLSASINAETNLPRRRGPRQTHSIPLKRRATEHNDICDIFAIIDFEALKVAGQSSVDAVVAWIFQVYQGVNRILRTSGLEVQGVTYGVKLNKVVVYADYTKVKPGEKNFNMADNKLNITETLVSMTKYKDFSKYCLAHLTTGRRFNGPILGVASIAAAAANDLNNGICSKTKSGSRNVGFSTTVDSSGRVLPTARYIHVMAHELGHNFGSEHDPDSSDECVPSTKDGGKFLMWPFAGSQLGENSKRFSPCSLKKLEKVMMNKAHLCFRPKSSFKSYCGDGLVAPHEDCDPGFVHGRKDNCCSDNCRFKAGAVCSPFNMPCCTNTCQLSEVNTKCVTNLDNPCAGPGYCSGLDAFNCAPSSPMDNGTPCQFNGTCWHGQCLSYCEYFGQQSKPPRQLNTCNCDASPGDMCKICCRDIGKVGSGSKMCTSVGGVYADGVPCLLGRCARGMCISKKPEPSAIQHDEGEMGVSSQVTIAVVVIVGGLVLLAGALMVAIAKTRADRETDLMILRKQLEEVIGHLNQPPDERNNPTKLAIDEQLRQARAEQKSARPSAADR